MSKISTSITFATILCFLCGSTLRAGNPIIEKVMQDQADRIPREAMVKAFDYYEKHADQVENKKYVTIVDFNRPSIDKRMHVINMETGEVEDLLVAHGKNSGNLYASDLSNQQGSNKSSAGIYLTGEEYIGKHGLSLRLDGMEPTNNNVRKRDIVMHGALYVSPDTIKKLGRLGKSNGCLALEQPLIEGMVKKLEGKSVILVYRSAGSEAGHDKTGKIESGKTDE